MGRSVSYFPEVLCVNLCAQVLSKLELHPGKLQLLQISCSKPIFLQGHKVEPSVSMAYLGSTLSSDGSMAPELNRRIGLAKADFRSIRQVWTHSSLSRRQKLNIVTALVETKLLHGLSGGCFTKAQLRRLDGFQNRCLRTILKIPSAYISRIPNKCVLETAGFESISAKLVKRQLILLGKVLRCQEDAPMHTVSFTPGTLTPATCRYVRRVGLPRKEWVPTVLSEACRIVSPQPHLKIQTANELAWKRFVKTS